MNLSAYERETIIIFNEEETTGSVYTHNKALQRKLEKLAQERPEDCKLKRVDEDSRSVDYIIPKKWVKINTPRKLSEKQLAARRESLKKAHLAQK